MESALAAASSSAAGPVTFSHVFGQQCQLMEAGRKPVVWVVGRYPGPPVAWARVSVCLISPRCNWECEVQPARDMTVWQVHFKVFRTCHETGCATRAGYVRAPICLVWLPRAWGVGGTSGGV